MCVGLRIDERRLLDQQADAVGDSKRCFLTGAFEATLESVIAIAFFIPLVLALNESVAMQSMTLSLQSLHQSKHKGWMLTRLRRELGTAFLLSLGACVIAGIIVAVWQRHMAAAVVVAATILVSLVISAVVGQRSIWSKIAAQ